MHLNLEKEGKRCYWTRAHPVNHEQNDSTACILCQTSSINFTSHVLNTQSLCLLEDRLGLLKSANFSSSWSARRQNIRWRGRRSIKTYNIRQVTCMSCRTGQRSAANISPVLTLPDAALSLCTFTGYIYGGLKNAVRFICIITCRYICCSCGETSRRCIAPTVRCKVHWFC